MNFFKKIALVALVAVWLPATSHCLLVALSGFESLACCSHEGPASTASHDGDCHTDACGSVESGLYKVETAQLLAPAPVLTLALFDCWELTGQSSPGLSAPGTSDPPTELLPALHFRTRAALPSRAPDTIA